MSKETISMKEAVARAIGQVELEFYCERLSMNATRDDLKRIATTAIKAMRDATSAMVEAGQDVDGTITAKEVWQAMIDAALSQE